MYLKKLITSAQISGKRIVTVKINRVGAIRKIGKLVLLWLLIAFVCFHSTTLSFTLAILKNMILVKILLLSVLTVLIMSIELKRIY